MDRLDRVVLIGLLVAAFMMIVAIATMCQGLSQGPDPAKAPETTAEPTHQSTVEETTVEETTLPDTGGAKNASYPAKGCDGKNVSLSYNEFRIFTLQNKARKDVGAGELCVDNTLTKAAISHAKDEAQHNYFDHTSPSGETVEQQVQEAGFNCSGYYGQNLAWGFGSYAEPDSIFKRLMNSPEHHANIVNPNYNRVGISAQQAQNYQGQKSATTYAMDFGSCPSL